MSRKITTQSFLSGACGVLVLLTAGCSTRSTNEFVPAKGKARKALEEALTAWQKGEPAQVATVTPKVNAVDSRWKTGAKLAKYEVLSEEAAKESAKLFQKYFGKQR